MAHWDELPPPSSWYLAVATPAPGRVVRSSTLRMTVGAAILIAALNLYAPANPTFIERAMGSLLIFLVVPVTRRWLSGRGRGLPLLPIITLLYATYCGAPIFLLRSYRRAWFLSAIIPSTYVEHALLLCCLGLGAMLAGYAGARALRLVARLPKARFDWPDTRAVQLVATILAVVGLATQGALFRYIDFGEGASSVPAWAQQMFMYLTETPIVGLTMLYALDVAGYLSAPMRILMWLGVAAATEVGFATGALARGIEVMLPLLFVYCGLRRRIPWLVILAAFASFLVTQPAKIQFRILKEQQPGPYGVQEQIEDFAWMAWQTSVDTSMSYPQRIGETADRINLITMFAAVVSMTPDEVPFWRGHTYYPMLYKLIPRLIYPDKPREDVGQEFPHRYGFLQLDDNTTSINLPQIIEAYVNFGSLGVVLVMALVGGIYQVSEQWFVNESMGIGAVVGAAYIFSKWCSVESNLSIIFGAFPFQCLYLGLIGWLVRWVSHNR